jgi:hypothetical protein
MALAGLRATPSVAARLAMPYTCAWLSPRRNSTWLPTTLNTAKQGRRRRPLLHYYTRFLFPDELHFKPFVAVRRRSSPFVAVCRRLSPFVAVCRRLSPFVAVCRRLSPVGHSFRTPLKLNLSIIQTQSWFPILAGVRMMKTKLGGTRLWRLVGPCREDEHPREDGDGQRHDQHGLGVLAQLVEVQLIQ